MMTTIEDRRFEIGSNWNQRRGNLLTGRIRERRMRTVCPPLASAMRCPRRTRRVSLRPMLAVVALFAQLVAATGAPVIAPRNTKTAATPFPCQDHPCGCATPEQGWAGDCCCFTLEAKLAWAEARGIEPPAHVRPAVEARKAAQKKTKSCCAKHEKPTCCETEPAAPKTTEAPALRWVAGVFAQKCRGEGPAGLLKFEAGAAPAFDPEVRVSRPEADWLASFEVRVVRTSFRPPIPPPRLS